MFTLFWVEVDNSNGISAAISRCGVTAIGTALWESRSPGFSPRQSIATVTRWVSGRTCSRTDGDIAAQMPR